MSDYLIREYQKNDVPELTKLWTEVFDEDERMLSAFFAALEHMGSGLAAVMDEKIVGAGYVLDGQKLVTGKENIPLGHIYGIAVYPEYRSHGIGRAIVKATAELAKKRGARIICCEPANQSLVRWYDDVLGMKVALRRQEKTLAAGNYVPCRPISAEEYALRREQWLHDKNCVVLTKAALGFEEDMLSIYGGSFFEVDGGIAAAYLWEDYAIIRELLCPDDIWAHAASSVACAIGAKEAKAYVSSKDGEAYILSDKPLPPDCIWNLSFN